MLSEPEEWAPTALPQRSPPTLPQTLPQLLNDQERARIESIRRGAPGPGDVVWLCDTVERLAAVTHDQFRFPVRMGAVNYSDCVAVETAFVRPEKVTRTFRFPETTRPVTLLEVLSARLVPALLPVEALLVVRPFVRIVSMDDHDLEILRAIPVSVEIDGTVVGEMSMEDILMRPDGTSFVRVPYSFPQKGLYDSVRTGHIIETDMTCHEGSEIGKVALSDESLKIIANPGREFGNPEITVGIVAARYTTRLLAPRRG